MLCTTVRIVRYKKNNIDKAVFIGSIEKDMKAYGLKLLHLGTATPFLQRTQKRNTSIR